MSYNFVGQTIPIPNMQGLKKIVSVKSTDRISQRLPPLRGIPHRPQDGQASALPPIGASTSSAAAGSSKQPSISATFTTSNTSRTSANTQNTSGADNPPTNQSVLQSAEHRSSIENNVANELRESRRTLTHQPREATNTQNLDRDRAVPIGAAPRSTLFQTTDRRTDELGNHQTAARVLNRDEVEAVTHLEDRGVRTWPVLVVFGIFCCNPVLGMIAAVLTLKAENNYYRGHLLQARREARVAKFFLILTVVTGCCIIVGVVVWVCVLCVNDECPKPR